MSDFYQLIIPMTGSGQRFVNAGYEDLKPLIQTGIGSMIECVLRNHSLIHSPICIISKDHPQKSRLRAEILRIRKGARVFEIGGHTKGPSFAVNEIERELKRGKPSIINYCDFSGIWSERELINLLPKQDGLILTYKGFHPHMLRDSSFAFVRKDREGRVIDIREKSPFTRNPMNEEASSGTYAFRDTSEMIEAIRLQIKSELSLKGEFYTSLTYKPLIDADKEIKTFQIPYFFQWGTPRDLVDFQVWSYSKFAPEDSRKFFKRLHSNIVIMAAGKGTRLHGATRTPKPLVKIFEKEMWNHAAEIGAPTSNRLVITRPELVSSFMEHNPHDYQIKSLSEETFSPVETAKYGLGELDKKELPVHVLVSDNLIPCLDLEQIENQLKQFHMVAWVSESYLGAVNQETDFSWVETDSNSFITKLYLKSKPHNMESKLIIGNFSFQNTSLAEELVEKLYSKQDKRKHQAELHLENLIPVALDSGIKVGAISLKWFAAVGTMNEYRIAKYFESAFSRIESSRE